MRTEPSISSVLVERGLALALGSCTRPGAPTRLPAAMRYAVFPGGARIRPRLCLAVARACVVDDLEAAVGAAVAIELLHCASLVHDDLPCFDDASMRRGKASVHRAFGERLAILAGDALIVLAFETIAVGAAATPARLAPLVRAVSRGVGAPTGIVAGQAWECEAHVVLSEYQQAKTGALFAAATTCGAIAAGADPEPWRALGERLGEAYQVADDLRDVVGSAADLGKPIGRDVVLGRPTAAGELGVAGALARLESLVAGAIASIPDCPGAAELIEAMRIETAGLIPKELARQAA